jgi:hypothetical protein
VKRSKQLSGPQASVSELAGHITGIIEIARKRV